MPTTDELAWLASDEGQSVCREMDLERPADTPAHIAHWRERLEPGRVAAAWCQVLLRRRARDKFSRADDMLLDRVGLEQATDETVANHKARRFAGVQRVVDLCCGIGGDAVALAGVSTVTAVDWSPLRIAMTEHNADVYGRSVTGIAEDVAFCRPEAHAVHIDPDRRPAGPRRHDPESGSPDLATLRRIVAHYVHAAVKLSPGAAFDALGLDAEIEVISRGGECKQAVAWTGRFQQARRRATVLPSGESIVAEGSDDSAWPDPGSISSEKWLFEPDPAVIRADLVGILARRLGLAPVDRRIAYLLGDAPVASGLATPFRILAVADFSAKLVRQLLAKHEVGSIEIKSRGFAARPEDLRRLLHLRGNRRATLFLTRVAGRAKAILASRPEASE